MILARLVTKQRILASAYIAAMVVMLSGAFAVAVRDQPWQTTAIGIGLLAFAAVGMAAVFEGIRRYRAEAEERDKQGEAEPRQQRDRRRRKGKDGGPKGIDAAFATIRRRSFLFGVPGAAVVATAACLVILFRQLFG